MPVASTVHISETSTSDTEPCINRMIMGIVPHCHRPPQSSCVHVFGSSLCQHKLLLPAGENAYFIVTYILCFMCILATPGTLPSIIIICIVTLRAGILNTRADYIYTAYVQKCVAQTIDIRDT